MKYFLSLVMLFIGISVIGQINDDHLEIGDKAPQIIAVDQNGKQIDSESILKKKQILLIFYRGNWCPYCNQHLSSLQEHLKEFEDKGVYVVVVSPESVERTKETGTLLASGFSIVHDAQNKIMNDYKVAFEVNEETVPIYYEKLNQKLSTYNVDNNMVLPVPATYMIDKDGKISYVHYDPDYKKRSDLKEILEML